MKFNAIYFDGRKVMFLIQIKLHPDLFCVSMTTHLCVRDAGHKYINVCEKGIILNIMTSPYEFDEIYLVYAKQ